MVITKTSIPGVLLLEPAVYGDTRGFFMETYSVQAFSKHNLHIMFVQDNHSLSRDPGVIRGLHYQLHPKAQTKLIRVVAGEIYDVVVDLRQGSPAYGRWEGFTLSAANKKQLLIPRGLAHGFCTTQPDTEVCYKVDAFYSPAHERGIRFNDPVLSIDWPALNPILSEKDLRYPTLSDAETNFTYEGGEPDR